ncbi:hypothetical protein [Hymenobacter psoromatis]|uniref:hypothetical protein n=1 Tax=Hymenobacter psoromatis TaxID=1484116 RepID=UPI001CC16D5D|nr:hypothetical protein [Hymenobacter psoromatis]
MPTRYTTAEVIEAVNKHPERLRKVTRESALSLPVPLGSPGQEQLTFFWYIAGGPPNKRTAGAPTFRVTASLNQLDDITFLPIQPDDTRLGAAPATLLGDSRIGGPVPAGTMPTLRSDLFMTLDSVLDLALTAGPVPDANKAAVAHLNELYRQLSVLVLLPAYRALNPSFFAWLEQNAA